MSGRSDRIPVVIVHWNQPDWCLKTVQRFREQGLALDIVLVDNGSSGEALERLRRMGPGVELLTLGKNLGFGPAANRGLRHVLEGGNADLIVLAPHDALPAEGCLRRLVDAMRSRPRAGMAGAVYDQGLAQRYDWVHGVYLRPTPPTPPGWNDALYPHGTLSIYRRACLEEIGLFDERYFAYSEEADLGLRARRAGWEVGAIGGAVVHNPMRAASSEIASYLNMRNSILLVRTHSGLFPAVVRSAAILVSTALLWARPRRRAPGNSTRVRLRAVLDCWTNRFGPPPAALAKGE